MVTQEAYRKIAASRWKVWRVRWEAAEGWRVEYFGPNSFVASEKAYARHICGGRRCLLDQVRAREVVVDMRRIWTCKEPRSEDLVAAVRVLGSWGYQRGGVEEGFGGALGFAQKAG